MSEPGGLPAPIEARRELPVPPEEAFDGFTRRMGEWWDAAYTPDPGTFSGVDLDPQVGGEVAMLHGSDRFVWGRVTVWEPGSRYEQLFWLAHDRTHPSELVVDFEVAPGGSALVFRHGGWTSETAGVRDKFGDWGHLLDRYAASLRS